MISALNLTVKRNNQLLLKDVSFELGDNDHLIIAGSSGSGKTLLANVLAGKIFANGSLKMALHGKTDSVLIVQRMAIKGKSNLFDTYYQQRFNSSENENADTLAVQMHKAGFDETMSKSALRDFDIDHLYHSTLLMLSSGEHKKFQLTMALLKRPSFLILDEPYIGLDAKSRELLSNKLSELALTGNTQIILIQSGQRKCANCFTKMVKLEKGAVSYFGAVLVLSNIEEDATQNEYDLSALPQQKLRNNFSTIVRMNNVHIQYVEKVILEGLNWEVKKGERWLVRGPNGSGKSTLLSLLTGDNPQAYANDIYLFDRKRGSGESIWEIKKNIGYLSAELFAYFDKSISCYEAIASGFFDTMGYLKKMTDQQSEQVHKWLRFLHLQESAHRPLSSFSEGMQRLILMARALIKNAPLLILDEPCQGLDATQTRSLINLVNKAAEDKDKTIIYVSHYQEEVPQCINKELQLTL